MADEAELSFWQADGRWHCAVPRPDPLSCVADRGKDWWKRHGLVGMGKTKEAALADYKFWKQAFDVASQIY